MGILKPEELFKRCDQGSLKFDTTDEVPVYHEGAIGQERALRSIEFGLELENKGFNIFLLGDNGTGKTSTIKAIIEGRSQCEAPPKDWCYVYNFKDADVPSAISFEPGRALHFQKDMEDFLKTLKLEFPKVFDSKDYEKLRSKVIEDVQKKQKILLEDLDKDAQSKGFTIKKTSGGLFIVPLKKTGEPMTEQEFEDLDDKTKKKIEKSGKALQEKLNDVVRILRQEEKITKSSLLELERKTALDVCGSLIDELKEKYAIEKGGATPGVNGCDTSGEKGCDNPIEKGSVTPGVIGKYLDDVRDDVLNNINDFKPQEEERPSPLSMLKAPRAEQIFSRYHVNVIVNNAGLKCAPCVFESNPTYNNLFGRLEYKFQYGMAATDFTMIKAGSLHKANGGYLIVYALDLLKSFGSYDALKRALRNAEIKLEDVWEQYRPVSSASLKPESIPLKVKIILIGDPRIYYLLYTHDEEYREFFKVKADFESHMERNAANVEKYAAFISAKCKTEKLLPFDRTGAARVIEHGSRIAEHQGKLTTKFNDISDLLREAHFWAKKGGAKTIDSASVERALAEKRCRHGRIDDLMQEQMHEGTMIVETSGVKTGQINGLAVIGMGDYSFGKPSRITASTFAGRAGVVNIERETKMSGKIHEKAILILSNYLGSRYARKTPITLTASITFEQLYGMIEGDSATCAEFYALISSISGVPIRQDLAITGSMDQNGNVQPIGGVNEKIEGFFDLCLARGLKNSSHGVVIPALNVRNLMLKPEVVEAAAAGLFHIHAISHIDEGMEILMGMTAGNIREDGTYPENTINHLVEKRLTEITEAMRKEKTPSNNGNNNGGAKNNADNDDKNDKEEDGRRAR